MTGYSVKIAEISKEVTAKQRVMLKDTSNAIKLDAVITNNDEKVVINPDYYAVLNIHNEKSDTNKDYNNYMIVDKDGTKYITGSPSFWDSFNEIYEEMKDVDEDYSIEVYKMDSKNYKGKKFLTCSIV